MKKILTFAVLCITLTGCFRMTPSEEVDRYFEMYKGARDEGEINAQLLGYINRVEGLTEEQRDDYRNILEKQYDFLTYNIKDEEIDGDNATVRVQIEVYDLQKVFRETANYVEENREEFYDEDDILNIETYNDYLLDQLRDNTDTTIYTINIRLRKNNEDKKWDILPLSQDDLDKIHGVYEEAD
ncbi:MAG TPA: hypothetical protein GX690_03030 [Tenericutes bacterium]|jgi:hypothetical protein|nr:hypothetical protein [Mycoplasmatota bacterium]